MASGGIRTFLTTLAHRPFADEIAQKYLFNAGVGADAILQKLDEGIHARMIDDAPITVLPFLGSDRQVLRGLTESDESYRARVRRVLNDYQVSGNAWAVLGQVLGYVLADRPAALTVSTSYDRATGVPVESVWNYYAAGDDTSKPPRHLYDGTGNWNWDQLTPTTGSWGWWRWYLVLQAVAPNNWIGPAPKWGGTGVKWGGYSGSWGVNRTSFVGKSLKIIVGQFKALRCDWMIISFDASLFDPAGAAGVENPDGYYGRWSKVVNGVYVRSRNANARYFEGMIE